jgi:hypothetical protein
MSRELVASSSGHTAIAFLKLGLRPCEIARAFRMQSGRRFRSLLHDVCPVLECINALSRIHSDNYTCRDADISINRWCNARHAARRSPVVSTLRGDVR